jgi:hypothetical protein
MNFVLEEGSRDRKTIAFYITITAGAYILAQGALSIIVRKNSLEPKAPHTRMHNPPPTISPETANLIASVKSGRGAAVPCAALAAVPSILTRPPKPASRALPISP